MIEFPNAFLDLNSLRYALTSDIEALVQQCQIRFM